MGAVSAKGMVVTSMAISTMEDLGEITLVVITMDTMASITTTQKPRRTSLTSPVSSARRLVIMPPAAQKTSPLSLPSPIHFRKVR
jgi:hypothetical protein